MNATFNIQRFGLTIYKELLEKYRSALIFWAVLLLFYLAFWALTLIAGGTLNEGGRSAMAITMLTIACFLAPFILYKNENRRIDGIFYAASPSSTLEKTLSMLVIVTGLFPILTSVILLSVDSLLTVLPIDAGFRGSIWDEIFSSKQYIESISPLFTEDTRSLSDRLFHSLSPFSLNPYTGLLLSQSVFVFLNMLFRRHKIGISLITIFSIYLILIIIVVTSVIGLVNQFGEDLENMDAMLLDRIETMVRILVLGSTWIIPIVMWVCTYLRIKRIQY